MFTAKSVYTVINKQLLQSAVNVFIVYFYHMHVNITSISINKPYDSHGNFFAVVINVCVL